MLSRVQLWLHNGQVHIKPQGFLGPSAFARYMECARGSKYDSASRLSTIPAGHLAPIVRRLIGHEFDLSMSPDVAALVSAEMGDEQKRQNTALALASPANGRRLYPYQQEGVQFLSANRRGILADDMGLGKTVQTCASIADYEHCVIVCPASVKSNWARHVREWTHRKTPIVLSGVGSFVMPRWSEVVITNYDILPDEGEDIALPMEYTDHPFPWHDAVLVADECHKLRNKKTKTTKRFRYLADKVQRAGGRVIGLTGTPILNRPDELWTILETFDLAREAFGSKSNFLRLYGGTFNPVFRCTSFPDFVERPPEGVAELLSNVMLRRTKEEVRHDLPLKRRIDVEVDVPEGVAKLCDIESEAFNFDSESLPAIEHMSFIRATLASSKIPAMLAWVQRMEDAGERVVVFSSHRLPIQTLGAREGWRTIMGGIAAESRGDIEDTFNAGKLRGVACTIAAGGVGLRFKLANYALFVDLDWTPALNEQAEERLFWIDRQSPATIYRLVGNHPLEKHLAKVLTRKDALISATIDDVKPTFVLPKTDTNILSKLTVTAIGVRRSATSAIEIAAAERLASEAIPLQSSPIDRKQLASMRSQLPNLTEIQWKALTSLHRKYQRGA